MTDEEILAAIAAVKRRRAASFAREPDPIKVRRTVGEDFAQMGHRLDRLDDEKLISPHEPRWIDGRRYVWSEHGWVLSPDLHRTASPPTPQPPRVIRATRTRPEHIEGKLNAAVGRVVDAGGRPEEVVVVTRVHLGRPSVRPHVKRIVKATHWKR